MGSLETDGLSGIRNGIITGMIKSFQAMGEGGGADSAALYVGISEALINTAFGILTSWCAVDVSKSRPVRS